MYCSTETETSFFKTNVQVSALCSLKASLILLNFLNIKTESMNQNTKLLILYTTSSTNSASVKTTCYYFLKPLRLVWVVCTHTLDPPNWLGETDCPPRWNFRLPGLGLSTSWSATSVVFPATFCILSNLSSYLLIAAFSALAFLPYFTMF